MNNVAPMWYNGIMNPLIPDLFNLPIELTKELEGDYKALTQACLDADAILDSHNMLAYGKACYLGEKSNDGLFRIAMRRLGYAIPKIAFTATAATLIESFPMRTFGDCVMLAHAIKRYAYKHNVFDWSAETVVKALNGRVPTSDGFRFVWQAQKLQGRDASLSDNWLDTKGAWTKDEGESQ